MWTELCINKQEGKQVNQCNGVVKAQRNIRTLLENLHEHKVKKKSPTSQYHHQSQE